MSKTKCFFLVISVEIILSENYSKKGKISYDGILLSEYCKKNGICIHVVKNKIRVLKNSIKYKDSDFELILEEAIKRAKKASDAKKNANKNNDLS